MALLAGARLEIQGDHPAELLAVGLERLVEDLRGGLTWIDMAPEGAFAGTSTELAEARTLEVRQQLLGLVPCASASVARVP